MTSTRQPLSGWAIRSRIVASVQRTETCPPVTVILRSRWTVDVAVSEPLTTGGDEEVPVAWSAGERSVTGVVGVTVVPVDRELSELPGAPLMSAPARSMATQAVAETPATVASQISAMPTAERSLTTFLFITMSWLPRLRHHRDTVALHPGDRQHTAYRVAVASILLIEDDSGIRSATTRALTDLGHAVTASSLGMAGLQSAVDNRPDVVLLDLGLPDVDGLQVLAMLRAVMDVPVIIITARDDDADMVKALDAGADDYVVKPFGIEQVDARLRAVLRRSGSAVPEGPLVVGGLTIDARTRQVSIDGAPVDLSRKEFDLLLVLAQRSGEVVTKRELLADVWRQSYGGGDRTVDVHLSWLRRKLGETAADPRYLHSVRGVGVRLAAPDDVSGGS